MDKNPKATPKDIFFYLLAIGAFYFALTNWITLTFSIIERFIPDSLDRYRGVIDISRWSLASLVVVFPIFFFIMRAIEKSVQKSQEKSSLRIRKWLLSLTVFLSALLVLGDLVVLLYQFLEGDLAARFLFKVLAVFVAGTLALLFSRGRLQSSRGVFSGFDMLIVVKGSVLVLAAIVIGFLASGSPFRARDYRFDETRISDLQSIQYHIINYWQSKQTLPSTLDNLTDSISGFVAPRDPQTDAPYTYTEKGPLSFELCADFIRASRAKDTETYLSTPVPVKGIAMESNWTHGAGSECFARTIDPDLYKPANSERPLPF